MGLEIEVHRAVSVIADVSWLPGIQPEEAEHSHDSKTAATELVRNKIEDSEPEIAESAIWKYAETLIWVATNKEMTQALRGMGDL